MEAEAGAIKVIGEARRWQRGPETRSTGEVSLVEEILTKTSGDKIAGSNAGLQVWFTATAPT
jgi:hypothetical protein